MPEPTSPSSGGAPASLTETAGSPPVPAATSIAGGFVSSAPAAPASAVNAGGSASSAPPAAGSAPAGTTTSAPTSSTDSAPSDASLDARLDRTRSLLDASKQALADEARRRETDDRSTIAKTIVNVFVWLMVGLVVAVAVGTASDKGWEKWKDAAEFLLKALSSVLLPVVTLVIGYYFGKEKQ